MQRLGLIAVGAALMAVIAVTTSMAAGGASGPKDAVWGGGGFEFTVAPDTTVPRDFSLNVELGRFGGADGTFVYGRNGVFGSTVSVGCLAVSGNHAVIGGTYVDGHPYLMYLADNGSPGIGTRDQVTPLLLLEPNEAAEMPVGFPKVCPAADVVFGGTAYADATRGDVVVRDVP